MERLTEKVVAAMDREARPALKLAAAVREHVVFHGLTAARRSSPTARSAP